MKNNLGFIKKPKGIMVAFLVLFCGLFANTAMGQTTIFDDTYGTAPATNYSGGTSTTPTGLTYVVTKVGTGGTGGIATINSGDPYLQFTGVGGITASTSLRTSLIAAFSDLPAVSGFAYTPANNTRAITWTVNMRMQRLLSSAYGDPSYYGTVILCASGDAFPGGTGSGANGYALIMRRATGSSTQNSVRLVHFTDGVASVASGSVISAPLIETPLSASATTPNTTTPDNMSLKVVYTPNGTGGGTWEMFYRADGGGTASAFTSPTTGTALVSAGTSTDATYTNVAMTHFGAVASLQNSALAANSFQMDNYKIAVGEVIAGLLPTTWNGTAWSNGTPTSSNEAIIDGAYSTTANGGGFTAKKLTVNSAGSLTINSGTNLTITNEVINNSSLGVTGIVVENNANLIQRGTTNTNTGAITVNRDSNPLLRLDYTMWSSPVSGTQTLEQFSPLTSQSPNRFYTYDPATDSYTNVAPTTPFATGTGYLIRMPNDASAVTPTAYSGTFTGVPNNGTVTLGSLTADKYYSVGNPYPSTMDAALFLSGNSTDGTLYFWRKTNAEANSTGSAYATWTTFGSAASNAAPNDIVPNGTIQVGQGFIVKTGLAATSLAFTNAMRLGNTSTQFFKTKQVAQKDRVWLNLTNTSGVFSQALVGYMDGATLGVDNGIDAKYINDSKIALTSNINDEEYTIQGRPTFDVSDVVALNFKTDAAGDYTIALDHFDGVFAAGQDVYLVDSKTGTETNLKSGSYTFNTVAGVDNTRFNLKYQTSLKVDAKAFNDNSVAVYKNNGTLYVNSGSVAISNIKVFDIQGRLIAEQKNVKATTAAIKNLKATQQVLVVKITAEDNNVVTKKVVN